ncbi:hypothetical protein MAHJHV59_50340 [Mycobacterium avium subsp. hominissuis]
MHLEHEAGLRDYTEALGPQTGFVLKVHPSNFHVTGLTSAANAATPTAEVNPVTWKLDR